MSDLTEMANELRAFKKPNLLVTCGDSFSCGSGLAHADCFEKSYAGLMAEYKNVPQLVLGRAGCCNFTIWLQIKHATDRVTANHKPFILITMTNAARTVWFKPGQQKPMGTAPNIRHLNYKDYPPYDIHTPELWRRDVPVDTDHSMQSETLSNLDTFFDKDVKASWPQFENHEPNARLRILRDWVGDFFSFDIKNEYDLGILLMGHLLMKANNIPHLFMGHQPDFAKLVPEENYENIDWGWFSQRYPDPKGTGHCDYTGHQLVFEKLKEKVDAQWDL